MPKKKITIRGFIGLSENATPEFLEKELSAAGGQDIDLEFSSGGGFVFDGLEMANMVRNYSGHITAKITGLAASMSSYIPMMADTVIAEDNAVFMIHNPMGGVFGADFREAEKLANRLRSLRDVLAKAYVAKTGKSMEQIQTLMDEETFFFGDEIVEEGFADSVIAGPEEDKDKDTAVALAEAEIADCVAKMRESGTEAKEDFERAAAFLKVNDNVPVKQETQPPAAAGKTEEVQKMTLKELLAANPEAKAEHDADIASARAEGETAGKETMNQAFTAALPILASESYPETVKERVTAKAQAGDVEGLKDFVAIHDMTAESAAAAAAAKEEEEETPGQGGGDGKDVKAKAAYEAKKKRLGGEV